MLLPWKHLGCQTWLSPTRRYPACFPALFQVAKFWCPHAVHMCSRFERPGQSSLCVYKVRAGVGGARQDRTFLKAESIRGECEASLRRLKVDVIDLYQIHWPDPDADIEEGWEEMLRSLMTSRHALSTVRVGKRGSGLYAERQSVASRARTDSRHGRICHDCIVYWTVLCQSALD